MERLEVIYRIDLNLFTAVFLSIVLYLAFLRLDHKDSFNRLYFWGCLVVVSMLVFEALTCIFNHNPSPTVRAVSTVLHVFLFTAAPLLTCFWFLLSNTCTRYGDIRKPDTPWPYFIPAVAVCLLALLSPSFRFIFYIDDAGVYHRGSLFMADMAVTYAYLLAGFLVTLVRRKNLAKLDFLFLVIIDVLPMIGGLIQGLVYGVLFIWSSSAGALTIMYMYLQERMVQTDYQTGAWTRHSFEYSITQKLKAFDRGTFAIAYADIDNLKSINDRYGHLEGDEAIRAAVQTIKSVLGKGDAVARLGGDEFAVYMDLSTREELDAALARIREALDRYNRTSGKPFTLSLSIGADLFDRNGGGSFESIVSRVDRLMYEEKKDKKKRAASQPCVRSVPLRSAPGNQPII